MEERVAHADPEVIHDLLKAATKDPQQLEALLGSLVDQAQHDPAVAKALTIATSAALRSTPKVR